MPYILVDTCVFTRLEGAYKRTQKCIQITSDVIGYTKDILEEYKGRAGPNLLILQAFIQNLENGGKMRFFKRSYIESAVRRYSNKKKINYPTHFPDRKWCNIAIAIKARYIISTNGHLLKTRPNQCNGDNTETLEPMDYAKKRCPDLN